MHIAQEVSDFRLDHLREEGTRTVAQNLGERIAEGLWLCQPGMMLVSDTAYHSFGGEVAASNTPTIRCLTLHAVTNFCA